MASQVIESHRDKAEVFCGDSTCKKKIAEILEELCLPPGVFPVDEVEELGYDRDAGFLWVRQRRKKEHMFKKIKQLVSYATEMTAYAEKHRIRKLTGVKTREFLLWLTITEVYIDDPSSGKITFKTGSGLSESFPVSAFEIEELKG